MKAYEYLGNIYLSEDDVDTAIELNEGGEYNNRPVPDHMFAQIWHDYVEEIEVEVNSFSTFKDWCSGANVKPSHYSSLERYKKEVGR